MTGARLNSLKRPVAKWLWVSLLGALCAGSAAAAPRAEAPVDFATQVRPIISGKCFACHGADEGSRKAKLRLDLRDEAVKVRKGGVQPIIPGDPEKSELIRRVTSKDVDELMPPPKEAHPVTPQEVEILRRWIKQGAEYTPHWAFRAPVHPPLPKVSRAAWPQTGLDYFILEKQEKNGFRPSQPADRYSLIRRVYLDLIGLPPTPDEVNAFVRDRSPFAYEKVVDKLLKSPAYGERWARVWLDLARYADSTGYGSDPLRLNIWPYRDWLIGALNRNEPFDQFTIKQIAGDLLPNPTEEDQKATAFHRNTMTNTEGGTDDEEFRVAAVKDRANVTAQVWMGLTMGCAQCHTHKFDPITHREYYQFFAFFNQTEDNDQPDERPTLPLPTPEEKRKMDDLKAKITTLEKERNQTTPKLEAELRAWVTEQAKGVSWEVLKPTVLQSTAATTLKKLEDDSILASGISPEKDSYVVQVPVQSINLTAFKLELMPDDSLPKHGPGRAKETGKVVVNKFEVSVRAPKAVSPKARFVRVELPGTPRILALAEVEVMSGGTNLARNAKPTQSSTEGNSGAALATDGNHNGDWEAGSVTLTQSQDSPWWELDLGSEVAIDEVIIWNRSDKGLGTRLSDFKVLGLDEKRKESWKKEVGAAPAPVAYLRLPEERTVKLRNASADFGEKDYEVAKSISGSGEPKSGWSIGDKVGALHAASYEIEVNTSTNITNSVTITNGSVLVFKLAQNFGTNHTIGRFRLSATSAPLPVRVHPENIATLIQMPPEKWNEKQKEELLAYFRDFAPMLAQVNKDLKAQKKALDDIKPVGLPVMKELAKEKRRESHILQRGNFMTPGDKVEAGVPAAFNPYPLNAPTNRLGLAQWLVDKRNPLTARVAVNRLWAQLFGAGLVETEEDFGTQGALPTHPALLDWLASEYMENGWDTKAMLKLMVMSATYQQSSKISPADLEKDPRNRFYSRATRRRLDAETVRDQALAAAGLLSPKIGGPSIYPLQPEGMWRAAFNGDRTWATSKGEDRYRRGVYVFWRRTVPYPSMATFDAPSRENCTARRIHTNTPLQAFVTLNDPVYVEAAQALGRRLAGHEAKDVEERIRYGLELVLGRPPVDGQISALKALYVAELKHYQSDLKEAEKLATEPLGKLPGWLDATEGAAWTSVANVLLNLDAVLTKG